MKKQFSLIATATLFCLPMSGFAEDGGDVAQNWKRHCAKCHAKDGSGSTRIGQKLEIMDYTDPASLAEVSDEELFDMTKNGVEGTKMPGYEKKLSDDEIHALVAYMRAMSAE